MCLLILAGLAAIPTGRAQNLSLVPLPRQVQLQSGTFTLCPTRTNATWGAQAATRIIVDTAAQPTGQYLAAQLLKSTGFEFQVAVASDPAPAAGAIVITTANPLPALNAEGYELTVTSDSVLIRAPTAAGTFYGVQTLLQLLPPQVLGAQPATGVQWTIPCLYIQDQPRFPWRGWMLDSVRHFFEKDEVKKLLDAMALHKLNRFHWHLDDDAGWRMEIKKWPLLTQVGAWRTNILFGLNARASTAWRTNGTNGNYGGYYTQDELREIVAYAAQRHITVVPEIEMPGHSTAAIKAYPQFACGCPTCSNSTPSIDITNSNASGVFCAARPETLAFLQDILTEVMDVFPGPYIHIGGDEVNFGNWSKHSLDLALTNSLGLGSMQLYQSYFTQQIANWVKSRGRTMIGWSEFLNGGLVTNAMLMDWKVGTSSRAVQAATNGLPVVMTPTTYCYINEWENGGSSGSTVIWSNEPPAQSGYVPLATVYSLEPVPASLPSAFTNNILGPQGNNWAEFIPSLLNMEFRAYPRLCALAEVGWTPAALKNYTDFTNRLVVHKQRLTQAGINYNPSAEPPRFGTWVPAQTPATYSTLTWDITASVTGPGEIDVSFCYKTGAHGLDIAWAALLENDVEVDRDTHAGFTGASVTRPAYILRLPKWRQGAKYALSASVQGRGGTDSTGVVYHTNWD